MSGIDSSDWAEGLGKELNDLASSILGAANEADKAKKKVKDLGDEAEKAAPKTKKETKELKGLASQLNKVLDVLTKIKKMAGEDGIPVKINNKGFTKVLDEMSKAIDNFRARANYKGDKNSNFFESAFGTKKQQEEVKRGAVTSSKEIVDAMTSLMEKSFDRTLESITTGFKRAAKEFNKEIKEDIWASGFESDDVAAMSALTNFARKGLNLRGADNKIVLLSRLFSISTGKYDERYDKDMASMERAAKRESKERIELAKIKAESATNQKRITENVRLDRLKGEKPEEYAKYLDAIVKKEQNAANATALAIQVEENKLRRQEEADERRRRTREKFYKKEKEYTAFLDQYKGKELTKEDKVNIKLREQVEQLERLEDQANENKGNWDAYLRTMEKIRDFTRQAAAEEYKRVHNYDKIEKSAKKVHEVLSKGSVLFQRASALTGSVVSIFNTIRSQAKNLFGYFSNNIRSLTSQLRTQLSSAINAGTEQYQKLEEAKIGFESFYGAETAQALAQRIQSEAKIAPSLGAGDLADYVMQLAPVSNGNSDLALNAALGVLKTIQYGGADSNQMEYVIKNIRDVITKGTAGTVDIRQFNRAMPALEAALERAGMTSWLTEESDGTRNLKITKENAKQILELFADLNVGEDSPVKDIFERTLNTITGLKEAIEEQRNTTFANIFDRSGAAELVRDVLKMLNDDTLWTNIENFFVDKIQKVVKFLRSVDWIELGSRFKEGWTKIKEALTGAKEGILGAIGIDSSKSLTELVNDFIKNKDLWNKFWDIITNFINSFSAGVKDSINSIKWVINNIDADFLKNAASFLGYAMSPMGKIWSVLLGILRDALNGVGRLLATGDSLTQSVSNKMLKRIQKAANLNAQRLEETGLVSTNLLRGGYVPGQNTIVGGTKNNPIAIYGNAYWANGQKNFLRNSSGQFSTWQNLSLKEKAANVGWTNTITTEVTRAFEKIGNFTGKAVNAAIIKVAGDGLTEVVSSLSDSIVPGSKKTVEALGKVTSTAVALGSQFGVMAGLVGGLITSIKQVVDANDSLRKAEESLMQTTKESSLSGIRKTLINNVMDNLQEAGLYDPYEEDSEDAYKAVVDAAIGMNQDQMSRDPATAMKELYKVYMQRRGTTAAGHMIDSWIEEDNKGQTLISSNDVATLRKVAEGLAAVGAINLSESTIKEIGNNYKSWQGYLKSQGFGFNTTETLNSFAELLGNLSETFDGWNNKEMEIKLLYNDGENIEDMGSLDDSEMLKAFMEKNGFTLDNDVWKTKALIELETQWKNGETESQKNSAKMNSAAAFGLSQYMAGPIGALFTIISGTGFLNNLFKAGGGKIKPIYRAGGGDARGVDTVPVMAQPGEFIIRKSSVDKAGMTVMAALNRGDLAYAARSLGTRFGSNSWNHSRNWTTNINNNQRSSRNNITIFNRNASQRVSTYLGLANRIALA